MPDQFHQPWSEVDSALTHGGIPGELDGKYVAPMLGDNARTRNSDLLTVFCAVRDCCASLSMAPTSNVEGPPNRNMVEETLRAINWMAERILDRTRASCNHVFEWTHARPPLVDYTVRPIRFPLRSPFVHDTVFHLLGLQVEIAESNANALHAQIDPSTGFRLLAVLDHVKRNIMLDLFDKEPVGDIAFDEQGHLMGGLVPPGPVIVPSSTSMPTPDPAGVALAKEGVPIFQWYPSEPDWVVFGNKRDAQLKTERLFQPEGAGMTTEDVAPETAPSHPGGPPSGTPG